MDCIIISSTKAGYVCCINYYNSSKRCGRILTIFFWIGGTLDCQQLIKLCWPKRKVFQNPTYKPPPPLEWARLGHFHQFLVLKYTFLCRQSSIGFLLFSVSFIKPIEKNSLLRHCTVSHNWALGVYEAPFPALRQGPYSHRGIPSQWPTETLSTSFIWYI